MKNRSLIFIAAAALFIYSCTGCKDKTGTTDQVNNVDITLFSPGAYSYSAGDTVKIMAKYPASLKVDSVVYSLDSVRIGSVKDSSYIHILTDTLPLGTRLVSAKIYQAGKIRDVSTNIYLKSGKDPEKLTYRVIKKFPHDTSAYTEGLLYHDGYLYESTGEAGHSELRKVELETGKVIQRQKLADKYFGEGSAIVDDKIVMFTYKDKVGFVFDKNTFKQLSQFNNNVGIEGWGVTYDGNKIYLDDSTNRIWLLDKNDYHQTGFIDVYDNHGPVEQINELEYIDGKIYSNIYTYDTIIVIDPKTGAVLQSVNMENLWPQADRPKNFDYDNNVLNGIASGC
ncbi:glutaminyl-peptide cyclotransferase [Mucilaginibacter sp. S1162]|uniref:Glutaminyl-peptide cyclotransferase n=1 Tax=Mucilaginibacter humi TaxID=2732510 RepID=A0ABX1W1X2_9SPHI|nr:glutaminyl-peptide cyclotransferase [Mucilaginibacter humi]NNU34227.1 glutaminyl-peptide cyclotransferase [Mucilaginibacter humi]